MRRIAVAFVLTLVALPALAHDFWIEPATFRPARDERLEISLRVGDIGRGDAVERKEERIVRFLARGPDGDKPILGRDGATPAGFLRPKSNGVHVLGFQSNHASVALASEKFMSYLEERGLQHIAAGGLLRRDGEPLVREIYSRSAKAIVKVGEASNAGFDAVLGLQLELTPTADPLSLARGNDGKPFAPLPIQLCFRGEPLAGALVAALNLDAPPRDAADVEATLRARTDEHGRVRFELPRAGRWLVAAVHMIPAEDRDKADYESWWGSLTFEVSTQ